MYNELASDVSFGAFDASDILATREVDTISTAQLRRLKESGVQPWHILAVAGALAVFAWSFLCWCVNCSGWTYNAPNHLYRFGSSFRLETYRRASSVESILDPQVFEQKLEVLTVVLGVSDPLAGGPSAMLARSSGGTSSTNSEAVRRAAQLGKKAFLPSASMQESGIQVFQEEAKSNWRGSELHGQMPLTFDRGHAAETPKDVIMCSYGDSKVEEMAQELIGKTTDGRGDVLQGFGVPPPQPMTPACNPDQLADLRSSEFSFDVDDIHVLEPVSESSKPDTSFIPRMTPQARHDFRLDRIPLPQSFGNLSARSGSSIRPSDTPCACGVATMACPPCLP